MKILVTGHKGFIGSHVFKHLQNYQQTISDRLLGTIIQPFKMDDFTLSIINIALQLYKPKKPLCITDSKKKAQKFIKKYSV